MNKERFLDVNGFNIEYEIPLEKRLYKYQKGAPKGASQPVVNEVDRLDMQSQKWRGDIRRKQVAIAIAAAIIFVFVIAAAVYLTYFL